MPDLDILQELIKDDAVLTPSVNSKGNKSNLVLKENDPQNQYQVEIRNIPGVVFAFKPDNFPVPDRIFNNSKGVLKRADFVIFVSEFNNNWIFYIEMKSGKGCQNTIIQQLKGATCIIAYCRAIGKKFWQNQNFLKEGKYQQRFISIKDVTIDKKPSIDMNASLHDTPERMKILRSPNKKGIQFKVLK